MTTEAKLRMTAQRKVILEELKKLKSHPTAAELCHLVRNRMPRVSLGTVYRNLDILSQQGLVRKLEVGGREMRFDGDISNHHHLRCLGCGKVADAEVREPLTLEDSLVSTEGFQVLGHALEFFGFCPDCQKPVQ